MSMPSTYTEKNETGCCAFPNIDAWDNQVIDMQDKPFIKAYTKSALFVPLNMDKVMTDIQKTAHDAKAEMPGTEAMILSRDLSPWKAEHLYAVTKNVDGIENTKLTGKFISKVFEGPYSQTKTWHDQMTEASKKHGGKGDEIYLFYTTCPKCSKHYGKNYVIGLSRVP